MQDLQQAVAAATVTVISSGAIEKAIEESIKKTIEGIVKDHFREYSDFGKQVKEQIGKAMAVDLKKVGLPMYGDFIRKLVVAKLDEHLQQEAAKSVDEMLSPFMVQAPESIKLSELIDNFKTYARDQDFSHERNDITVHIEESNYGSQHISFDIEPNKAKYSCAYRISVHKDDSKVYSMQIDNEKVRQKLFIGPFYNFERDLYQMYLAKTKIIVDISEDDIDCSISEDN